MFSARPTASMGGRGASSCPRLASSGWQLAGLEILQLPAWIPVEQAILDAQQVLGDVLAQSGAAVHPVDLSQHFGDLSDYYRHYLTHLQCVLGGAMPPGARAKAAAKMRTYDDPFLGAVADGLEAHASLMLEMLQASLRHRAAWETVFADVDVLLSPVCNVNAFPHDDAFFYDRQLLIDGAAHPYYRLSAIPALASLAGLPATVFPTGRFASTGAPIGLQAMGRYLDDRTVLRFARLVEAQIGGFVAAAAVRLVALLESRARRDAISRMQHDPLAGLEPGRDLGLQAVLVPDFHLAQHGPTAVGDEHGPPLALAEEGREGHLEHVAALPEHDARLDAIAVTEALPLLARFLDVDDHVDALLFDAERRHLGESEGLDAPHDAFERWPNRPRPR